MGTLAGVLILVIILGIFALASIFDAGRQKKRIREYLNSQGATAIEVTWEWQWSGRSNYRYTVEYTNRAGEHCQTSCKIETSLFGDGEIYWTKSPEE